MHRHPYWLTLLSFLAICVLGYTGYMGVQLYHYWRLSMLVPVHSIQWSVSPMNDEAFAPQARYQFSFNGKEYQGETLWPEHFLNSWAAGQAINQLKKKQWSAWIDPSYPYDSTLQKTFPIKQLISAAILWILFIYFIVLERYVNSYHAR